jgi:hypothetical protein
MACDTLGAVPACAPSNVRRVEVAQIVHCRREGHSRKSAGDDVEIT